MKVTMLTSVSSVDASYGSGQDYDLPEILAKQWIKAGYAEAVDEPEVEEPASVAVPEPIAAPVEPAPQPTSRRQRKPRAEAPVKTDLL